MSIICLEGASAVGKTTVCKVLEKEFGFLNIAEVNQLFKRSSSEPSTWYFERQIDRWKWANDISKKGGVAVLDGDPFQPVWYNWIFKNEGLQPLNEVFDFYQRKVLSGEIEFPNKYFLLEAPNSELKARKDLDVTRSRRNFDNHLKLIKPQKTYFKAMNRMVTNAVEFIESDNTHNVAKKIVDLGKSTTRLDSLKLVNAMFRFIESRL